MPSAERFVMKVATRVNSRNQEQVGLHLSVRNEVPINRDLEKFGVQGADLGLRDEIGKGPIVEGGGICTEAG
jgi:hypothetical protein